MKGCVQCCNGQTMLEDVERAMMRHGKDNTRTGLRAPHSRTAGSTLRGGPARVRAARPGKQRREPMQTLEGGRPLHGATRAWELQRRDRNASSTRRDVDHREGADGTPAALAQPHRYERWVSPPLTSRPALQGSSRPSPPSRSSPSTQGPPRPPSLALPRSAAPPRPCTAHARESCWSQRP